MKIESVEIIENGNTIAITLDNGAIYWISADNIPDLTEISERMVY